MNSLNIFPFFSHFIKSRSFQLLCIKCISHFNLGLLNDVINSLIVNVYIFLVDAFNSYLPICSLWFYWLLHNILNQFDQPIAWNLVVVWVEKFFFLFKTFLLDFLNLVRCISVNSFFPFFIVCYIFVFIHSILLTDVWCYYNTIKINSFPELTLSSSQA